MESVEVSDDGKTKVIRNDTDGGIHVAYSESEDVTNSFSSNVTKGVTLDVTKSKETKKDASVTSSQSVSGEYAGVKAEVSLSEHFGISQTKAESRSKSSSSEIGREQSIEGTKAESLSIEFDAKPQWHYLVTIVKEREHTEQPFAIDGVQDFDMEILLGRTAEPGTKLAGHCRERLIRIPGVGALAQFVRGYDTRYPEMEGFWEACTARTRNGINRILRPETRQVQVSGINYATLESNVDYRVEPLGLSVPDGLQGLPVVRASDA